MLGLEVRRVRITKNSGEDELDEYMEGRDEKRIGKCEGIGREHRFVIYREQQEPA